MEGAGELVKVERDAVRLKAAFAHTNRSPLGACAITGTGFDIDRTDLEAARRDAAPRPP